MPLTNIIIASTIAFVAAILISAGLYVAKSALGVDLMAGPSPLHDILYQFAF